MNRKICRILLSNKIMYFQKLYRKILNSLESQMKLVMTELVLVKCTQHGV